eukprot:TRINITY_DN2534_c0_g1_i1.p1 TRINITY_DN2534_c0_g1~~TRINITY_DN2534_c0_g1_i1.p1  ORF type:complete len:172 (+),score=41.29 TRINITY_DN2534_c0_g1_i1:776-1291(+)
MAEDHAISLESWLFEAAAAEAFAGQDAYRFNLAAGRVKDAVEHCSRLLAEARKRAANDDAAPLSQAARDRAVPPVRLAAFVSCVNYAQLAIREPSKALWAKQGTMALLSYALERPDLWPPASLQLLQDWLRTLSPQGQLTHRRGPEANRFDDDTRRWARAAVSKGKQAGLF